MSFYSVVEKYSDFDFDSYFKTVTSHDVKNSLKKEKLDIFDFLNLISPVADDYIEEIALKAHNKTIQYFGKTIYLYTPLYIANYCTNECIYCGFNKANKIKRKKLTLEEIEKEASSIAKSGVQHILFLTGEAKEATSMNYLCDSAKVLKKYFSSISVEILPLETKEYKELFESGVDGLTIYQEVYNENIYKKVHLSGEKTDYRYRLDAPERGAKAGFARVGIGTLFGLGEKHSEALFAALHAKYLQDNYPETQISLSLPRITNAEGDFKPYDFVDDKTFVKFMMAYRLFLPRVGITVSTRESKEFRDNLLPLGVTSFSAGSKTEVGGYTLTELDDTPQFSITDERSTAELVDFLKQKGYQPIFKDWEALV